MIDGSTFSWRADATAGPLLLTRKICLELPVSVKGVSGGDWMSVYDGMLRVMGLRSGRVRE